jgi:hypothetical protein
MDGKERRMYRKYGQKVAPAISAYPPSLAVYAAMPWMARSGACTGVDGQKFTPGISIIHDGHIMQEARCLDQEAGCMRIFSWINFPGIHYENKSLYSFPSFSGLYDFGADVL